LLDELVQDARFGVRTWLRQPAFAAAAILTLALATGATTAIFSVLDAAVLRPLPFGEPDELVQAYGRNWREDRGGQPDPLTGPVVYTELDAYRAGSSTVQSFAAYQVGVRHLTRGTSAPERLNTVVADVELFDVLRVEPVLGRTFRTGDRPDVAVIGSRLWKERLGGDPGILGTSIRLDDRSYTVIGVMPDRFQFPYRSASIVNAALSEARTDAWIPLEARRGRLAVVARLKPGVAVHAAEADLRVIAAQVERQLQEPGAEIRVGIRLEPLADVVSAPVRRSLWMLFAGVTLVLAAACANVANLLLARMAVRVREVLTRAALGAGQGRLARQFLAESVCLGLAGGAGGLVIAWGARGRSRASPDRGFPARTRSASTGRRSRSCSRRVSAQRCCSASRRPSSRAASTRTRSRRPPAATPPWAEGSRGCVTPS